MGSRRLSFIRLGFVISDGFFLEEGERVLSKKDQSFGEFDIIWPDCSFRTSFRCF